MPQWNPILYREFWDQPRTLLTTVGNQTYLFYCPFDEAVEEFSDTYTVYKMPALDHSELDGSWIGLEKRAISTLGIVVLTQKSFDPTIRKMIDLDVLQRLTVI